MTGPGHTATGTEKVPAIEILGRRRILVQEMRGAEGMNASIDGTAAEVVTGIGTGRTKREGTAVKVGTGKDRRRRTRSPGKPDVFRTAVLCSPSQCHRDRSLSPHSKAKAEKKAARAALKREEELRAAKQIAELNMYTAEDNPFHDANLGQQFQWHKKREKEKKSGITEDEAKRREQARRLEAKVGSTWSYLLCL
jgi:hypothetical protein